MIRLTPDRLAEIDLRRIAQGARGGAEHAAENGAGHRHADRQARQRADAGADAAAGDRTVPRCRAASGQQKPTGNTQNGNTIYDSPPSPGRGAEYRDGFFSNARVLNNTKGYGPALRYKIIILEQEHRRERQIVNFGLRLPGPEVQNQPNQAKTTNWGVLSENRVGTEGYQRTAGQKTWRRPCVQRRQTPGAFLPADNNGGLP